MNEGVCSSCNTPAPKVKTAGTMANLGWRIQFTDATADKPATAKWICPKCAERVEGSAPLSNAKAKR